jgi:hypothetical protein
VECESAGSGGDLVCNVAATKSGNPTTVGAPGYPSRTAVLADGTNDYWTLGDTAPAGSFTVCASFRSDLISASVRQIVGKTNAIKYSWRMYTYNDGVTAEVITPEDGSTTSYVVTSGLSALAWNSYCFSYLYATSGTSTIRTNLNGIAGTPKTNAIGPCAAASGTQLAIGADSAGGQDYTGGIALVSYYNGWAASAAELAALVASQQARLASKPFGALVSVTSGPTTCDSRGDGNLYSLPAGSLCCGAVGCEIWGAAQHSNAVPSTLAAGWTGSNATASASTGLDGVATSAVTVTDDAATSTHYVTQNYTATAVPWVASAYFKAGTRSWVLLSLDSGNSGVYADVANCVKGSEVGATGTVQQVGAWCRVTSSKTLAADVRAWRVYVANSTGTSTTYAGDGTGTVIMDCPMAQVGTVPGPCTRTAGAAYVGAADGAERAADGPTNESGAVGACFTAPGTANSRVVSGGGTASPMIYFGDVAKIYAYDGTSFVGNLPYTPNVEACYITSWAGSALVVEDLAATSVVTGAYDGSFGTWTTLYLGSSNNVSGHLNGKIRKVCQRGGSRVAAVSAVRKCLRTP